MPVMEFTDADVSEQLELPSRVTISHPRLGIIAAGKAMTPEEFEDLRDELTIGLSSCDQSGPFGIILLPYPRNWRPECELSVPEFNISPRTSREAAIRNAVTFNRRQLAGGDVMHWACLRPSVKGANVILIDAPDGWTPETEYDLPPLVCGGFGSKEAKRIAREMNAEGFASGTANQWAVIVRHLLDDGIATGKAVQA